MLIIVIFLFQRGFILAFGHVSKARVQGKAAFSEAGRWKLRGGIRTAFSLGRVPTKATMYGAEKPEQGGMDTHTGPQKACGLC